MTTPRPSTPSAGKKIASLYALGFIVCATCGERLEPSTTEWDHVWQHATGGPDVADNLRPLCSACHAKKTKADAHARGKIRRLNGTTPKRRKGKAFPPGRPLQSRNTLRRI